MTKFEKVDIDAMYAIDPNLSRENVSALEEWLKNQPHLASLQDTELQAIFFLHSCYYDIEFAKKTINLFYTLRSQHSDLFCALPLDLYKTTLDIGLFNLLPQKTPEGQHVMLIKLLDTRTEIFNCANLITALIMTSTYLLYKVGISEGVAVVFDMKGYNLGHLTRMNLMALKRGLFFVQEAAPIRLKSVHFINIVPFMDKVVALAKPFLKTELYNMLNFHTSLESLNKFVPIECLPNEYGGSAGTINELNEESIKVLEKNYDFFPWFDAQKVDESKRPPKERTRRIFGLQTSFQKLEID